MNTLLDKVCQYSEDKEFLYNLQCLVANHEDSIERKILNEKFVKMILLSTPNEYSKLLFDLEKKQLIEYSETEDIPEGFCVLSEKDLVKCLYGPKNKKRLSKRTISLTSFGKETIQKIREKI